MTITRWRNHWLAALLAASTFAALATAQAQQVEPAQADPPDPHLAEFRERQKTNRFAHFVDSAAISQSHSRLVSDALRRVPGVVVRPSGGSANAVRLRSCSTGPSAEGGRGIPILWVDGARVPNAEIDDVVRSEDVAGIEIYSSLSGVPAQYFDRTATCGTILVWTRSKQ